MLNQGAQTVTRGFRQEDCGNLESIIYEIKVKILVDLEKREIKRDIMTNYRQAANKISKILDNCLDRRCVDHHLIGNIGQLGNYRRDRPLWINQRLPCFTNLLPIKTYRSDFNDRIFSRVQTGSFYIKRNNGVHSQDYTRGVFLKKKAKEPGLSGEKIILYALLTQAFILSITCARYASIKYLIIISYKVNTSEG